MAKEIAGTRLTELYFGKIVSRIVTDKDSATVYFTDGSSLVFEGDVRGIDEPALAVSAVYQQVERFD